MLIGQTPVSFAAERNAARLGRYWTVVPPARRQMEIVTAKGQPGVRGPSLRRRLRSGR